jgi:hypothetical protein
MGLEIRSARLGLGEVRLIEAAPMYELGLAAVKADPRLPLCDKADCLYCRER